MKLTCCCASHICSHYRLLWQDVCAARHGLGRLLLKLLNNGNRDPLGAQTYNRVFVLKPIVCIDAVQYQMLQRSVSLAFMPFIHLSSAASSLSCWRQLPVDLSLRPRSGPDLIMLNESKAAT